MGNRASISIANCVHGIYLQWNGGRGSIQAFVSEANKRYTASRYGSAAEINISDERYVFELYAAIREYFNFAGEKKHRGRDHLSLYVTKGDKCDEDNCHYVINHNGSIDFGQSKLTEDSQYTEQSKQSISGFFGQLERLMLQEDWL